VTLWIALTAIQANPLWEDDMSGKFQIARSAGGSFYFQLTAENGKSILSSQTYVARSGAEKAIESVRMNSTGDGRYERRMDVRGRSYFVLKGSDDQVIGKSPMYSSPADMEHGIQLVKKNAPHAAMEDLTISEAA
jgi:uncharacterized protein